jgi:hypothetical protein
MATECRTAQRPVGSRRPERSDYWRKGRHEHVNGQSKRQNSEASNRQRPNGLCEALFTYVASSTGEIRRGSSYGASAAAARSAMRTVLARADEGTAAKDSEESISAWVEHRLATCSRGNSGCRRLPRTLLGYQLGDGPSQSKKKPRPTMRTGHFVREISVELRGFEPLTPCMPCRCATSCATAPMRSSTREWKAYRLGGAH